ncbi:MAG: polyprenyl synthetase family protein [Clostridia bacterium]|nr:polyprenyl synthetase family protein [Clostridia bacterium]
MSGFEKKYEIFRSRFGKKLGEYLAKTKLEPEISDRSFKYSLEVGGKRVRPVIMLATAEYLGVPCEEALDFALPLELIHTYSLIHDDLPEMDDADMRRGHASSHKMFGAGYAVLAGDSLLNTAYSLLFKKCLSGVKETIAAGLICDFAGAEGMIAGQYADLFYEGTEEKSDAALDFIYGNKTGKLITAAYLVPSVLSGGKERENLSALGKKTGFLFQLVDDILDVEGTKEELGKGVGTDATSGKLTYVSLHGMDESKKRADELARECEDILRGMDGDTEFFSGLVQNFRMRVK